MLSTLICPAAQSIPSAASIQNHNYTLRNQQAVLSQKEEVLCHILADILRRIHLDRGGVVEG